MKTEDKMNKELNITFEKDVKSSKWYYDLKYAVIPLLLTVIAIIFSYFFNMWWGKSTGAKPEIWIDKHIPLIPWFVYFYFFTFPMARVIIDIYRKRRWHYGTATAAAADLPGAGVSAFSARRHCAGGGQPDLRRI